MALSFDDVLVQYAGQFGFYQRLLYVCISVLASGTAVHNLVHVFAADTPKYWCISVTSYPYENKSSIAFLFNSTNSTNLIQYNVSDLLDTEQDEDQCYFPNATHQYCQTFEYDTSQYSSTIVSEVSHDIGKPSHTVYMINNSMS